MGAVLRIETWVGRLVLALSLLIIAARIAAPYVLIRWVNDKLADLDGYTGHIDDVDLHLWRGAYQIETIVIEKTGGKVPVPFVELERLDLGLEWKALLDGAVVAKVAMFRPKVNFVSGPTKEQSQTGSETDWRETVKELAPLRIDEFTVVDGEVHYRDLHAAPKVDVYVDHLNVKVENLTNAQEVGEKHAATVDVDANVMHSGKLTMGGRLDPFAKKPTFDVKTRLRELNVSELNTYLKAYVNVDAEKGKASLYSELTAHQGKFKGYVKPLIEGLDLLTWKKETERPLDRLWEGIVGAAATIVTNPKKDRLATRIDVEGSMDKPDVSTWQAVGSMLRNAFIEALKHGLDPEIET